MPCSCQVAVAAVAWEDNRPAAGTPEVPCREGLRRIGCGPIACRSRNQCLLLNVGSPYAFFGGPRSNSHHTRGPMSSSMQNLKLAARQLVHHPGFTLTVMVTLALSIGANTAIFSVVNALILRSLPYPQPDRIGTVFERIQGSASTDGKRWI